MWAISIFRRYNKQAMTSVCFQKVLHQRLPVTWSKLVVQSIIHTKHKLQNNAAWKLHNGILIPRANSHSINQYRKYSYALRQGT